MAKDIERVYAALLDRKYQETVFGDLEGFQEKGNASIACCPFHADAFPTLVIYKDRPEYFCFVCSARGDWIRYLQLRKGLSFSDALALLSREAGAGELVYTEAQWQGELSRSILMELIAGFFTTQLFARPGEEVLHYLYNRGYAMGEVEGSSFGYYPGSDALQGYLTAQGITGKHLQPVLSSIWRGDAEGFNLTIPYRDSCGRLMGIIGRDVKAAGPAAYRPLTDLSMLADVPFLMYRARNREDVIIVDGLFDALLVDQIGFRQAVAVGKSGLTRGQAQTIASCGVRRCILCFGNGPDKERFTSEARDLVRSCGMEAALLPVPDSFADLDHFIRGTDLHDFKNLLRKVRKL
ncbi:MAG TPA: CHC2 zinc finger domain-containing protein [Deltaproteobacteria bacterium]|nr:CHC2 zinc finger domain-containing protein [Deltaproteobacteria bacterium]HOI06220.1 CHC2 zinc finger domain-containing protein [Deltaproteobacteria bacterium]